MTTNEDWTAWNEERSRFQDRDTEGFTKDLRALEQHIKNLQKLCPKDKAGWPVLDALNHISDLTEDYNRFKKYINLTI